MEALITGAVFAASLGTAWVIQRAALEAFVRLLSKDEAMPRMGKV